MAVQSSSQSCAREMRELVLRFERTVVVLAVFERLEDNGRMPVCVGCIVVPLAEMTGEGLMGERMCRR